MLSPKRKKKRQELTVVSQDLESVSTCRDLMPCITSAPFNGTDGEPEPKETRLKSHLSLKAEAGFNSISLFPSRIVVADEHWMLSPGIETDMLPLSDSAENR